jgi:hypothetical protein
MCGTNPAFNILKTWIEQKDLKGEEAAEVMSAIPSHLQTPGPDIVRHFYVSMVTGTCASRGIYEGRLKSSWSGGSAPLLYRGRRWLLCQVVVVEVT